MSLTRFNIVNYLLNRYGKINGEKTLTPSQYEKVNKIFLQLGNDCEPLGCGLSWIWWTGVDDPFLWAGCRHDNYYPNNKGYVFHDLIKKEVDEIFLKDCLEVAGENLFLKAKAWLYYYLCRLYKGKTWKTWKKNN